MWVTAMEVGGWEDQLQVCGMSSGPSCFTLLRVFQGLLCNLSVYQALREVLGSQKEEAGKIKLNSADQHYCICIWGGIASLQQCIL